MKWLLWSPDLSQWDFFLWWYMKGLVYIPHFFLLALMNSSRESLLHRVLLLKSCYSVFSKGLTTNLTCAMSLAVRILNSYEISPRINLGLTSKLFNLIELDLVVFKIIVFKMMSNFEGHSIPLPLSLSLYIYIYIYINSTFFCLYRVYSANYL